MIHSLFINDVSSDAMGVWLEKAPEIPIAAERGTWQTMPGRVGEHFNSDGALSPVTLTVSLYVEHDYDREKVIRWIMGAETVRVSPWLWEWKVYKAASAPVIREFMEIPGEGMDIEVSFKCEPYRYVWPHVADDVFTTNGTYTIVNPYSEACAPVITVEQTAYSTTSIQIKVNNIIIAVGSKTGNVKYVIDTNKKTVRYGDGSSATSKTRITSGVATQYVQWPKLEPGNNTILITVPNCNAVTFSKGCRQR